MYTYAHIYIQAMSRPPLQHLQLLLAHHQQQYAHYIYMYTHTCIHKYTHTHTYTHVHDNDVMPTISAAPIPASTPPAAICQLNMFIRIHICKIFT